jgi:hypothetical protein
MACVGGIAARAIGEVWAKSARLEDSRGSCRPVSTSRVETASENGLPADAASARAALYAAAVPHIRALGRTRARTAASQKLDRRLRLEAFTGLV